MIQHCEPSGAEVGHLPLLLADPDPLLACPPGSPTERMARERGIPTVPLPYRTLRMSAGWGELARSIVRAVQMARDLRGLLRAHPERPIVVGNTLTPSLVASIAAAGMRRKPVWVAAQFIPRRSVRAAVRLLARATAERVLVPSTAVHDDFVGRSRGLRGRAHVTHPGIDMQRFAVDRPTDTAARVALVGYISTVKRTDMALEIAREVAAQVPEFELQIVGCAQYRPEDFAFERALQERVAADPLLRKHVRFCGYERDVPALLANVSALLHCCPVETFGVALVEAMAAGVPVVAPAAGGPLDIVEHERTGLLYAPGDVSEAASQLVRLLAEPAWAREMGMAARRRVERRFTSPAYVASVSSALEGLVDA